MMKRIRSFRIWMISWLSFIVAGAGVLAGCSNEQKVKATEKPNFIIWVADDQFLESVGCYGGNPAHTPNIDKLAGEGLRFTRAYSTSSICTPARSALYTGMYPIKNVVTERYKLIHYLNHGINPPKGSDVKKVPEYELFDLLTDPQESVNLFEDETRKEIREDLEKRLQHWTQEVGDKGMETEYEAVEMFPEKIGHLKMPSKK